MTDIMEYYREHKATEIAFNLLKGEQNNWKHASPQDRSVILNSVYQAIRRISRQQSTHYISVDAEYNLTQFGKRPTADHYINPRIMVQVIIELQPEILKNFDSFVEEFISKVCKTVDVTSEQNNSIKYTTKNGQPQFTELTLNRYDSFGWSHRSGKYDPIWKVEFPLKHTIPPLLTEFEMNHLIEK